jgi:ankyrin repeat protein
VRTDPEFIRAAVVPLDDSHTSGSLDRANALLAADPAIAGSSIYAAAVLGDAGAVQRFIAADAAAATANGGPHGWDPLTHLCFSRYLRLDPSRSDGFVRAATALLDAGADANGGWFETHHQPTPVFESVLYGAAGVAHHAPLTRLLLAHGADPNDEETPYHTPETWDNGAMRALVESGRLSADSLAMMLLRKADWHDVDGMAILLEAGADANRMTQWGFTALHQALRRDNAIAAVDLLLDRGADPSIVTRGDRRTALTLAARRGRGDVLASIARRGAPLAFDGVDRLIAACAMNDEASIGAISRREPTLVGELLADGGTLLAEFALTGNADGVRCLLDLGVPVTALYASGDPYFGIPQNSSALHVAAWRARHAVVRLLVQRGAPVNAPDANDRTPLALAIRAAVDSYWMAHRSPASAELLLRAGASTVGLTIPSGYDEIDDLLRQA